MQREHDPILAGMTQKNNILKNKKKLFSLNDLCFFLKKLFFIK